MEWEGEASVAGSNLCLTLYFSAVTKDQGLLLLRRRK